MQLSENGTQLSERVINKKTRTVKSSKQRRYLTNIFIKLCEVWLQGLAHIIQKHTHLLTNGWFHHSESAIVRIHVHIYTERDGCFIIAMCTRKICHQRFP